MPSGSQPRDYRLYGRTVRSAVPLPGWPEVHEGVRPAVRIRLGSVEAPEPAPGIYQTAGSVEDGHVTLAVRGVARYAAFGGSEIVVDPEPGAQPEDVRLYLTGAVLGFVLLQAGGFPLHAAAVEIDGVAVAFAGLSGAGKSTLVATLVQRGARLITDDVSVVDPIPGGGVGVWPGPPRIKLDGTGLGALSHSNENLDPVGGNRGKYLVPVESGAGGSEGPVPLRRLYRLEDHEGAPVIVPLAGMQAVQAVVDETYLIDVVAPLGLTARIFHRAADLARAVKVCRLLRPRGFEHLKRVAMVVEADVRRA